MHETSAGRHGGEIAVDLGPGQLTVTHRPVPRERMSLARSRERIILRLLAAGLSAATLRLLLPERRALIDRLAR